MFTIEAIDREICDRSFYEFVKKAWHVVEPAAPFVDNWHIKAICDHLQAIEEGKIKRLIVMVPPRHSKSLLCSVLYPVWAWIKNPMHQFLCASYANGLSTRDAVRSRRLIASDWFQRRWALELTSDQNVKSRYDNIYNGYRIATSVSASVTGDGGSRIIVDDAINSIDSNSAVKLKEVVEWWDGAMSTRLNNQSNDAIIVIMQRLNERDLIGHILAKEADEWDVLCLPAEYETDHPTPCKSSIGFKDPRTKAGELLNPNRFSAEVIDKLKNNLGSYGTASQLQQRPSSMDGNLFKRWWFMSYEIKDNIIQTNDGSHISLSDCTVFATADTASTESASSDYSVCEVWAMHNKKLYLLDVKREQLEVPDIERMLENTYKQYKLKYLAIEHASAGIAIYQNLGRKGLLIKKLKANRNKVDRSTQALVMAERGDIYLPYSAPWLEAFADECVKFPAGKNDDQVDALSYACMQVHKLDEVQVY